METLDSEHAAIARRQRIADMLMQQSQEPLDTNQMAGGYVVPISPLAGVAKVAQALSGAYIGKKADDREAAYNDKKRSDFAAIDLNSPNAPQELMAQGMYPEAIKMRQDQATAVREAAKEKRAGIPPGYIIDDNGQLTGMPMPGGRNYEQSQLERAIGAKQFPGYGEPQRLEIAQSANDIALQELAIKQQEQQRKAQEASQPKQLTELQQYALDEKKAKKENERVNAIAGIDSAIDEATKLKSIQAETMTGPYASGTVATAIRKALPNAWSGGENLQRLEKGYNKMAVLALEAFKAGGVSFGQLSNDEGKWVKSTTATIDAGGDVNQEVLDEGLKLLNARKERINRQAGNISVDPSPNYSQEDRATLAADIELEKNIEHTAKTHGITSEEVRSLLKKGGK